MTRPTDASATPAASVEPHLALARAFVTTTLGFRPNAATLEDLPRRLERLASRLNEPDVRRLATRIFSAPPGSELRRAAIQELTIGETWLFRDARTLQLLTDILLADTRGARVRKIWSAGCSTGEEVHSLAFLCRELAAQTPVEIVGTDVASDRLAVARSGRYPARVRRGAALPTGFARIDGSNLTVRPVPGVSLSFHRHNLTCDPLPGAPGSFDLVVCRNVLLYLANDARRQALATFSSALAEGGLLLLGPADVIDAPDIVPPELLGTPHHPTLYRKAARPAATAEPPPQVRPPAAARAPEPAAPPPPPARHAKPAFRLPPSLPPRDQARLRVLGARAHLARGTLHDAEQACLEALDLDPTGVEAVVLLAEVAVTRGDPSVARRILEAALTEHGDSLAIRTALAALRPAPGTRS